MAAIAGCGQPSSTAQAPASVAADEAALRAGTVLWNDAYNAGEVDKIVALYAEDAMLMPANAPALKGRAAIKDFLTKDIAATKVELVLAAARRYGHPLQCIMEAA